MISPDTHPALRWVLLIAASALAAALLELAGLPAGLLIGPLVAAVLFAVRDAGLEVPKPLFHGAQAVVGCMVAAQLGPPILDMLGRDWPIFIGTSLATLGAGFGLGLVLMAFKVLPGTVPIWGASPGVATPMVLIAKDFGADFRLVAFMTYMRVLCVALAMSALAMLFGGGGASSAVPQDWFPHVALLPFAETVGIGLIGAAAGLRLGLPAGALLGPMLLGAALHMAGLAEFALPAWLRAIAYAAIGWNIGMRFSHETLHQARRALLPVLLAIVLLMGFCALIGYGLTFLLPVNLMSAYLATSPGGMASVAIIAASVPVDVPFVLTLQAVRLGVVLVLGPPVARYIANRLEETGRAG